MASESQHKIDVNQATIEELTAIEGFDEKRATLLLSYRDEHGPFQSWDDVRQVPGIDDTLSEKLRDRATLGGLERGHEETELEEIEIEEGDLGEALEEQLDALMAVARMDAEAAAVYEAASELIAIDEITEQLLAFRDDHLRHVEDLNQLLADRGGDPVSDEVDPDASMLVELAEAMGAIGPRPGLAAVIGNEQLTNSVYQSAMELPFDDRARALLERNLGDERRHLAGLTALNARDWEAE
jgi:competence protein ComEA